ncbi:hypothetical protein [Cellvibrio mixtus]|uniref:hypothetical protein n=1 Tax=Cellvibrio mixtus TaxID=39650 RepID=UPI001481D1CD|nr:hypothetical protein [Cellvibrio mixtus]
MKVLTIENQQLTDKYLKLQNDLNVVSNSLKENQETFNARIEAKFSELDKAIKENNESKRKSEEALISNSSENKKEKAEDLILESMRSYADLGVDMDHWDNCDKEYTDRYRKGKVLLDQIYSLNKKYKISDQYSLFVDKQYGMMVPINRVCKS